MRRRRLLLVEDDASIRRFVRLALRPLAVDVVEAATLASAREALATAAFSIVLTDLMLPDGNGLDLLPDAQAGAPGGARVLVMSAGVSPAVRERAFRLGAWQVLDKPVPVGVLRDCVAEALGQPAAAATASNEPAQAIRASAVERHFGGNKALYDSFKATCLEQFQADLRAGDAALQAHDTAALHRLAHSLKTVLQLLGADEGSALARALEVAAAETPPIDALRPLWLAVRAAVIDLR